MAAADYENIVPFNEALERLVSFKNANTEVPNFDVLETLINDFRTAIMSEVHG